MTEINQRSEVFKPVVAEQPADPFGPAHITHWSAPAGLGLLGTYAMTFDRTGESDPWTVSYEESIFVVRGQAWLVQMKDGQEHRISAEPGELLVLQDGATVRYGGIEGTLLLLSIAPVDWDQPRS